MPAFGFAHLREHARDTRTHARFQYVFEGGDIPQELDLSRAEEIKLRIKLEALVRQMDDASR